MVSPGPGSPAGGLWTYLLARCHQGRHRTVLAWHLSFARSDTGLILALLKELEFCLASALRLACSVDASLPEFLIPQPGLSWNLGFLVRVLIRSPNSELRALLPCLSAPELPGGPRCPLGPRKSSPGQAPALGSLPRSPSHC